MDSVKVASDGGAYGVDGFTMRVMINGSIESRPVISTYRFTGGYGDEVALVNRPLIMPDEEAVYFIDGRPPAIIKKLTD